MPFLLSICRFSIGKENGAIRLLFALAFDVRLWWLHIGLFDKICDPLSTKCSYRFSHTATVARHKCPSNPRHIFSIKLIICCKIRRFHQYFKDACYPIPFILLSRIFMITLMLYCDVTMHLWQLNKKKSIICSTYYNNANCM